VNCAFCEPSLSNFEEILISIEAAADSAKSFRKREREERAFVVVALKSDFFTRLPRKEFTIGMMRDTGSGV